MFLKYCLDIFKMGRSGHIIILLNNFQPSIVSNLNWFRLHIQYRQDHMEDMKILKDNKAMVGIADIDLLLDQYIADTQVCKKYKFE